MEEIPHNKILLYQEKKKGKKDAKIYIGHILLKIHKKITLNRDLYKITSRKKENGVGNVYPSLPTKKSSTNIGIGKEKEIHRRRNRHQRLYKANEENEKEKRIKKQQTFKLSARQYLVHI